MHELRTKAEVDEALAGTGVLFKHSNRCPVSYDAYDQVARFTILRPEVVVHIVDVVRARELSRYISDTTGIFHQSPQVIVVRDGEVEWHGSHYSITARALEQYAGGDPG